MRALLPLVLLSAFGCEEKVPEAISYEVSVDSLALGSARYDQDDFPVAAFSILSHDSRALFATVTGFQGTGADYLTQDLDNFSEIAEGASIDINESAHAVASSYFEVRGRLRLGDAMVDERSLVRKQGIDVTTLWRERGAFDRETTQTLPGAQR